MSYMGKMVHYIIGIAGGSGCGKSTLAYGLQDKYPELVEVVHFDDYQKSGKDVPLDHGMCNWDHPAAINFDDLVRDIKMFKDGKNVKILTKSFRYNPAYEQKGRIPHIMKSKKIIIIEGYMALLDKRVRELLDYAVFLDLSFETMMKRRTKFINPEYTEKILLPMHTQHIEPTKEFANLKINVEKANKEEVLQQVIQKLKKIAIL